MAGKTDGVAELVRVILQTLPKPYGEDIIEDVFVAIEHNPNWLKRYNELGTELSEVWVVNNWVGQHTRAQTGYETIKEVSTTRTKLAKSYSKLRRP